jgi:2-(1,2-epoxy-1,2-dihydrophenyl)acetyl-CoA isomerase
MHEEVRAALDAVASPQSGARVLVLTGAGRGFCAGQDLSDRAVAPGGAAVDLGDSIEQRYKPLVLALRALPLPGHRGRQWRRGWSRCEHRARLRSRDRDALRELHPVVRKDRPDSGFGGTWQLPRLLGTARAMGLALLGDKLSAEQAEQWGLIWRCVDDAEFVAAVDALAKQLAEAPTRVSRAPSRPCMKAGAAPTSSSSTWSAICSASSGHSADYAEGVAAFIGKRAPRFSGR